MSMTEILAELPRLSPDQRSHIARRLRELEENEDLLFLNESADLTFQEMDRDEKSNADRQTR